MNLEWYYTFIVLAKELNYRKASEKLFLTQPSIFQQIKKLEQHLKLTLFENINGTIYLTKNGKQFLPIAKSLLNNYETSMDKAKLLSSNYNKQLNIAVTPYIANYIIPVFLPIFFKTEPTIKVSILVDNNTINLLENGDADISILREEPFSKKINLDKICEGTIKLIVPNNIENKNITDELYYLSKYKILAHNHPTYWKKTIEQIYTLAPTANIISIEDAKISETLIKLNQGISYLPTYILNYDNENLLKIIEPQKIPSPISFTYLATIKSTDEIDKFNYLFKKFIGDQQKLNY